MLAETIDISSDSVEEATANGSSGTTSDVPKRKRIRKRKRPAVASVQADNEEEDEAQFSDGEVGISSKAADNVEEAAANDFFDFSGTVPAVRNSCPLCNEPLAVTWSETRKQLVHLDAVRLRNVVYHLECVLTRRGPAEDAGRRS